MDFVTLDEIVAHLRMDDITSDNNRLTEIGEDAEALGLSMINRTSEELSEMGDKAVHQFKRLVLQLCEDMNSNAGATSSTNLSVTPVTNAIVCSLRKLSV